MAGPADAPVDLLFGLLALQNGMVNQSQLVAAFGTWTVLRDRRLADVLVEQGAVSEPRRALLEALVREHLAVHGGDPEKSLAALPAGRSTRESLGRLADPEIEATLNRVGSNAVDGGRTDETLTYGVGTATSEGQRFRVLRPHARGGLGAVFVALDQELHREVALKQILDHHADDAVSRQRFLLEAEITGGLEHPGIVPVYGLGTYGDGRPYYAMRFVRGDSLKEAIEHFHTDARLKRDAGARSLELRNLLRRFTDVCNAIQYAHDRGILHRDIKPGNVIVGKHGETLVIDWGLAKPVGRAEVGAGAGERTLVPSSSGGSSETLPGSALGTPAYMSPEQAAGDLDRLGPRSDVYSLGATLYCLLTGKAPFEGETGDVLHAVRRGEFTPPRGHDPSLSRALEAVRLTAMALQPEDRYASCRALAEDIERWSADEPVSVYREPLSTRVTRWGRRHRTAAASAGVLLVAAVLGLSVGAALINRERAKAEANFRQARAAVDRYFTTVSESRLLNVPGLQPLRKELLDAAQEYYQDFLRERGDDPGVRVEAAAASFRVSWIIQAVGRPGDAIEPLGKAVALYTRLIRDRPGFVQYRRDAASTHGLMGLVLASLGRGDEALAAHRRALTLRTALVGAGLGDALDRNDLARTHHNIGNVFREEGRLVEALAEWDQALTIERALAQSLIPKEGGRTTLTGRSGPSLMVREDLARLQIERANALRQKGRHAEARIAIGESAELFQDLVRERPHEQRLLASLADVYRNDGLIRHDLGLDEEAERLYRRSLAIAEKLAAANPDVTSYRSQRTEIQIELTWILVPLGRSEEALALLREAVKGLDGLLAGQPDSISYGILLGRSLGRIGALELERGHAAEAVPNLRRALEIHEELARKYPKNVRNQSSLASALRGVGRVESKAGQNARARAAFERAAAIDRSLAETYPMGRYNLACTLAFMIPVSEPAERESLAVQAVGELGRGIKNGFADMNLLQNDNDLDPLRPRADFQALLSGLGAKQAKAVSAK